MIDRLLYANQNYVETFDVISLQQRNHAREYNEILENKKPGNRIFAQTWHMVERFILR